MERRYKVISTLAGLIMCFAVCAAVTCFFSAHVSAEGGINSDEARVIAVAKGSFEYNGEIYVAQQTYIDQLVAKLSQEDVDLTSEQADAAISAIYSNVETGVMSGYIVKVGSEGDGKEQEGDNSSVKDDKDNKSDNPGNKPDKKDDGGKDDQSSEAQEKDDSILTIDSEDGKNFLQFGGVLMDTGFSYQHTVLLILLLGVIILCVLTYSVIMIINTDRK